MATRMREKSAKRIQNKDARPYAKVKYVRMSPSKVRIMLDVIRGKRAVEAMAILENSTQIAREPLVKLLKSAIANAENNKGMNKDDIKLNYKDGVLSVAGTRQAFKDTSDKNRNIIHQERSEGSISRSYRLPNVVASDIHAKYDNGVLTITLPKQTASDDGNSIQID